jgi:hypothetical protein
VRAVAERDFKNPLKCGAEREGKNWDKIDDCKTAYHSISPPDDPRKLTAARSFKLGHDKVPTPFRHSGWPYVLEPGPLAERRRGWGKRQGEEPVCWGPNQIYRWRELAGRYVVRNMG